MTVSGATPAARGASVVAGCSGAKPGHYSADPLWNRIEDFRFDDPAAQLSFSQRLARENGWSRYYASRVIAEYKKFCYLAMTAGHSVTPSDEVDQAWHLHLIYTRSYWDGFCGRVLGRAFHHGPTRGGADESAKFHDWYEATLVSYQSTFGSPPPTDIWPGPESRFAKTRTLPPHRHGILLASAKAPFAPFCPALAQGGLIMAHTSGSTERTLGRKRQYRPISGRPALLERGRGLPLIARRISSSLHVSSSLAQENVTGANGADRRPTARLSSPAIVLDRLDHRALHRGREVSSIPAVGLLPWAGTSGDAEQDG